jgi:hypothetical protein
MKALLRGQRGGIGLLLSVLLVALILFVTYQWVKGQRPPLPPALDAATLKRTDRSHCGRIRCDGHRKCEHGCPRT